MTWIKNRLRVQTVKLGWDQDLLQCHQAGEEEQEGKDYGSARYVGD